jgi:hypothetical protein
VGVDRQARQLCDRLFVVVRQAAFFQKIADPVTWKRPPFQRPTKVAVIGGKESELLIVS